jgi:endo-1,4-beta-xylanase
MKERFNRKIVAGMIAGSIVLSGCATTEQPTPSFPQRFETPSPTIIFSPSPTIEITPIPTQEPLPTESQKPETLLPSPTLSELANEAHVTIASQMVYYKLNDPIYTETAKEVANELMINGETNISDVFANFDWNKILNNWSGVNKELTNGVNPYENDLNWNPGADELINFAKENNMTVMAGSLLWGGDIPKSVLNGRYTPTQLSKILEYIVKSEVLKYKGKINEWFVASEVAQALLFGDSTWRFWFDKLGMNAVYNSYIWAHEADPKAKLMIYESPMLDANNGPFEHVKTKTLSILQDLKDRKIPVNDVGFENNFWVYAPPNYSDMVATINQVKAMGYGIAPSQTIVDKSTNYPFYPGREKTVTSVGNLDAAQTKIYKDVFNAYLKTGSPFGIFGFTDAVSEFGPEPGNYNVPDAKAMILDSNYKPKHAYNALIADLQAYITSKK